MRSLSLAIWAFIATGLLVTAVVTHIRGHRLCDLVAALRSRPIGAIALTLGWAWVGWHFLVR
ncbi:DUF6186 family protein [Ferrimicrobium sp.]|uniref:DUF6186 family protein n=1 Tax=Ferrimicrobium sp. TaxID=2926050 RepID=UPI002612325F|nr:DUF6186 family protein [Ferrimicrobium sp.]